VNHREDLKIQERRVGDDDERIREGRQRTTLKFTRIKNLEFLQYFLLHSSLLNFYLVLFYLKFEDDEETGYTLYSSEE
jgi:hypothetical protein